MVVSVDYSQLPQQIMGVYSRRYQRDHIRQILAHYHTRHAKSAVKTRLLQSLVLTEKRIPEHEKEAIGSWMNNRLASTERFEDFLRDWNGIDVLDNEVTSAKQLKREFSQGLPVHWRGIPYPLDDSEADAPFAKRVKRELSGEPSNNASVPTTECTVCLEYLTLNEFPSNITPLCSHEPTICKTCLSQSIESQISDKPCDQIKCPECSELIPFESVRQILSVEAFEKYDRKSVMEFVNKKPLFTMCLGPHCGSGQIHEGGEEQPIMTCFTCRFKTCFKHKLPWHSDQTCDQYDTATNKRVEQEAATAKFLTENTKRCPNAECRLPYKLEEGCHHITCPDCQFEWCWECFAPHSEIDRIGNDAHDPTCSHYSDNLPVLGDFEDQDF